ncbi:hypothetical protein D3C72_2106430 [compost metagenome]
MTGSEPRPGTLLVVKVTLSSSRPPSTMIWPSSINTLVSMARLLVTMPLVELERLSSMLLTSW